MIDTFGQSVTEAREEEEIFRNVLPKTGFFGEYMKYTDCQESPGSFHFWVGATILGAALQNRTYLSRGVYQLYPNLYTVLVAPSGKCRKTRAMNMGIELVTPFDWLNLCADKTTPEALLYALEKGTQNVVAQNNYIQMGATDATGLIQAPELAVFINRTTYVSGMVEILTALYDCPKDFKYLTRTKKPIMLSNVAVCLLGASTPEWLATALPEAAFEGGFMSRIIFVMKFVKDRYIPQPPSPPKGTVAALSQHLLRIRAQVQGEMKLDSHAENWYNDWYRAIQGQEVEAMLTGFMERKPDTVLKLSMILAASEERTQITEKDIFQSDAIVSWTQDRMFNAFKNVDMSPMGVLAGKLMEILHAQGGVVSRREVLRRLWGRLQYGVQDLIKIEVLLEESGLMTVEHIKTGGRDAVIYRKVVQ